MLHKLLTICLVCGALFVLPSPGLTQQMGIVATVNSTPISEFDLKARLEMVIALGRLPRNQQTAKELAPKVIEMLVDEELKLQEAKNIGIVATKDEIELALRQFEKNRRMQPGSVYQMADQLGTGRETVDRQVEADLVWSEALRVRFRALTQITEEEVNEEVARLEANKGQPVILLSEIFLPVDTPGKDQEVRQIADRILGEIRNGASFSSLATTFSQNATAAVGGDLGWIPLNSLRPEAQKELTKIAPGEYSQPIRSALGYTIFWYKEKRVSQGIDGPAADSNIVLQQLFIPVADTANASQQQEKLSLAKRLRLRAASCEAMKRLPLQVAGELTSNQSTLRMSQLAPQVRSAIQDLQDNIVSEPVKVPGAILLFMICSRELENSAELRRGEIENRLVNERLGLASRQYLRDLRRSAFIERR